MYDIIEKLKELRQSIKDFWKQFWCKHNYEATGQSVLWVKIYEYKKCGKYKAE